MRRALLLSVACLLLLVPAGPAHSQSIPAVKAKALDDSEITLPRPATQQILILVVGFSKKSGDVCGVWGKHLGPQFLEDPRVNYYELPHLEGVPTIMKPMIVHGMRKDLTPVEQSHLVPLYDKQEQWKKLVNFSAPDEAYLIVADPEGHVFWQAHGTYSLSLAAELKKAVGELLQKSASPSH